MAELTPITAMLTADIAQFRAAMIQSSDLTDEFSMAVSSASVRANAAYRSMEAAASGVTVAQDELNKLQASGTATADEIAAAEARVAEAETRLAGAGERAALAQEKLLVTEKKLGETRMAAVPVAEKEVANAEKSGGAMALLGNGYVIAAAAAADMGYKSIESASKFDSAMETLHTQAQVPQAEVDALKGKVLGLAGSLGADPMGLVDQLYHVESSFESMPKVLNSSGGAMGVMTAATKGAIIGHSDLTATVDALDAAIASGIKGTSNAADTMAVLNAVVGSGDMKMQDLARAFSTGAVEQVKLYGGSLQDVGAILATFGDNVQRGQKAATQMRMAFQDLASPSVGPKAKAAFKSIHLSADELSHTLTDKGLVPALALLKQKFEAAHVPTQRYSVLLTDMFTKRAGTGITELLGQFDRLLSKYPAISGAQKAFADDWKKTSETFAQQTKRLEDGFKALEIEVGEKLIAGIEKVVKWVRDGIKSFEDWYDRQKILKAGFSAVGQIIRDDFIKPVEATYNWVKGQLSPAFADLKKTMDQNPEAVKAIQAAFAGMLMIATKLQAFISSTMVKVFAIELVVSVKTAIRELENLIKTIEAIIHFCENVVGKINSVVSALRSMPSNALAQTAALLGFEEGGFVPGPQGSPHLAIVHGGEFVVSNDMMRQGKLPGNTNYASSGASGGGGGGASVENHIYIDGREIRPSMQRQVLQYNQRNVGNGLSLLAG